MHDTAEVPEVLTVRALNRALLARQGLLERGTGAIETTVERLVGLHAQVPRDPYVALWSRLEEFDPHALGDLLAQRHAVRGAALRTTLHLVTARDYLALQPLAGDAMARAFRTAWAKGLAGAPLDAVVAAGRELLARGPLTRAQLSDALAPRWPRADPATLGQAVLHHVPVVQMTPRGLWNRRGRAIWATAEAWLRAAPAACAPETLVRRYLAAFGPASAADVRTWSRMTGARELLERLRPALAVFRDEQGRELLDLPDAPRPPAAAPAPMRFLPEYDNAFLAHADRTRILGRRSFAERARTGWGTVLVDGFAAATWRVVDGRLVLDGDDSPAIREGGERLLALLRMP